MTNDALKPQRRRRSKEQRAEGQAEFKQENISSGPLTEPDTRMNPQVRESQACL